jgi:SAM-dependent methyltransferase
MGAAMSGQTPQKRAAIETHSAQAGEFADSYKRLGTDPYGSCFAYSRHRLGQWLDRLLPGPARSPRVLDVGCGTGHHVERLRERGYRVTGLDGSIEMLRTASAVHGPGGVCLGDAERLPFPDASFDLVICIEVLRYLATPDPCVREMARVLRPGGVCLMTALPLWNLNAYWLVNRLAGLVRLPSLVPLRQFFHRSGALRRSCLAGGFARAELHGVYLGPVNWLERLARPLLPPALRLWEPIDALLADRPVLRDVSNMYLVRAERGGSGGVA